MRRNGEPAIPRHRSIRFKLVAAAIVVELFMLGVLLTNSYRLVNDALESQTRSRLEALAPLLNASLAGYVFQRDHSEIHAILKELVDSRFTEIRYIVVLDNRGQVIASVGTLEATRLAQDGIGDLRVRDALSDLVYDTRVPLTISGNDMGSVRFGLSLVGMVSLRDTVLRQSLVIAALAVILSLLLLTSMGYLFTRHLSTLLDATRRVARGDYASVIAIDSNDEIGILARDFNAMATAVQNRIEALAASGEALRKSESRFRSIFDNVGEAIFVHDIESGRLIDVNQRMLDMYGFSRRPEALAAGFDQISAGKPPYSEIEARAHLRKAIEEGPQTFEWLARSMRGEVFWVEVSLRLSLIDEEPCLLAVVRDVSERKKAEERINELAFFDSLTRLPNRRLLTDRLKQAIASGARNAKHVALLFIDLDNFKTLNDTLGHDIGDLLLQQVAERLASCVREGDTVARLGGDEFLLMVNNLSENAEDAANQAEVVGEKVLTVIKQSYQLASFTHHITASIGIALFADHQGGVDDLLKQADLAMYQAKAAGRNTLRFFDPQMQTAVAARAELETDLREGLTAEQFVLNFQPQIDGAGHVAGAEVLLRWQHPRRGLVPPLDFIPVAEDTGLILPIGRWVLEKACAQLNAWAQRPDTAHLTLAVNVSARQFHQPDFVDQVLAALDSNDTPAGMLKLELTESMLVSNVDDIIEKMTTLKARGVGFALDDFGTGYSSLSYLKQLPLDQLKIDQGFVRDILTDPNDAAIAKMVIALAESLGLAVIAEGVETVAQRDFLAHHGCQGYQGYLFSRPLPRAEFEKFLSGLPG